MEKLSLNRNRLILCREQLGITKQAAAKKMHMSQPAYLRYESGQRMPSFHVMITMAQELHTSIEYLTGQTDDPHPTSYVVTSKDDPQLFEFIEIYKQSDDKKKTRLLEYFHKIKRT